MAEKRDVRVGRCRLRRGERDTENGVRAEATLVRRSVELDQHAIEVGLVHPVDPLHGVGDLAVDVGDRRRDALAVPRVAAVAQLDRLVHAGRRTGRDDRPAEPARDHLDLDGRIPTGVQNLPGVNLRDHSRSFAWSK